MTPGSNITTKKVTGSLKKKSKSRDYQERAFTKNLVTKVKKGKKAKASYTF